MSDAPRRIDPRGRLLVLALAALVAIPLLPALASAAVSQFQPLTAYSSVPEPDAIAIGDVTGDGRADAVVTTGYSNNPSVDFKVAVLAQTAGGTLAAPVFYDTAGTYPNRPNSVAIGDVNGDGLPDVIVGISSVGVQVFPGLAGGGIGAPSLTSTPDGRLVRLGQLDGDGRLDVAAIGWGTNTVTVLSDTGSGLAVRATYSAQHAGWDDLDVGDVTGDGLADIVVMSGQTYAVPNLEVLPQLAGGGFGVARPSSVGTNINTQGIGVGDVTGDGIADVVASYGGNSPSGRVAVFAGGPSGLGAPAARTSYDIPGPIEVADLDGDGARDVIVAHSGWNAVGQYAGIPGGGIVDEVLTSLPYSSSYGPQGLAVGDLTGDGRPDIALADANHGLVVLANAGPIPSPSATPFPTPTVVPTPTPTPPPTPTAVPTPTPTPVPTPTPTPVPTFTPPPPTPTPQPTPITAPSAPRSLAATVSPRGGVTLTWSAPLSNGGAPITQYRIYRGSVSGGEILVAQLFGPGLSYTDSSTVKKTTYFYRVTAFNGVEGPFSNEVSITSK